MKLSKFIKTAWPIVWSILKQTKNYARIVGVILFAIGLIGFAFRSSDSLPDLYLGGALVLGFWGIISGLWDNGRNDSNLIEPEPAMTQTSSAPIENLQ